MLNLAERIAANPAELPALAAGLSDPEAGALVEYLKAEADRHWTINANRSLEIAGYIIEIGRLRRDPCQIALGTMARGDALKLLGATEAAWATLEQAGELFRDCGDEVGWARTRIGRVGICVDMNRVDIALAEAGQAREILIRHGIHDKCLILDLNTAVVYKLLGRHDRALALYQLALATANMLGEPVRRWLGPLYTNIGNVYYLLGDFRQAAAYHQQARERFDQHHETSGLATAELNLARVAIAQGRYKQALYLLHRARDLMAAEHMPLEEAHVRRHMVECYLMLNRFGEARDLAQAVSADFRAFGAPYEEAISLLHLASAEAELACFGQALDALDRAESIFAAIDATAWVATTRLRRGRLALRCGDLATAQHQARAAADYFARSGQQVEHASAALLDGQAQLATQHLADAIGHGAAALETARRCNVPALRYAAHLLLGQVAEAQGQLIHAGRQYRAAAATVDRVQRELTITLRPEFLQDKREALRALLRIQLQSGAVKRAFETLERAKSQALLGHLANREQLRWDSRHNQGLIDELGRLREEHHWFYRLAHDPFAREQNLPGMPSVEQARAELAVREARMRAITEQLYLHSGSGPSNRAAAPALREIQAALPHDTLLIEFYHDGAQVWAFTVGARSLRLHRLPMPYSAIEQLLNQLKLNIESALKSGPASPATQQLAEIARRILGRLYAALLQPIEPSLEGYRRLTIVPFGNFHYLPFHLLHTGSAYLVERHELVVLPTASMLTHPRPIRRPGAVVLAHSWAGRLAQAHAEAALVQQLFDGAVYADAAARRSLLERPPAQILHIAAHGEHRLDQPDLSYIELADGQLYADDLLQHDLSYELVTLSACETGRTRIAANDEPIGLGRGVLYAGAGALVVSLWRVSDETTLRVMELMYQALGAGASKATALRAAQAEILRANPRLHPAYWGAFQLIGNPDPLSCIPTVSDRSYVAASKMPA